MRLFSEKSMNLINGWAFKVSLAMAAALCIPVAGAAQEPMDVALMLGAALEEFETPNGPIVEVEAQVSCPGAAPGEQEPCLHAEVDSVIARYAEEVRAPLEVAGSPLPPCRWNQVESGDRMGVRLSAAVGEMQDGSFSVTVAVRCLEDPGRFGRGFVHSVTYPFMYVDGEWSRVGDSLTIVS